MTQSFSVMWGLIGLMAVTLAVFAVIVFAMLRTINSMADRHMSRDFATFKAISDQPKVRREPDQERTEEREEYVEPDLISEEDLQELDEIVEKGLGRLIP